MAVRIRGRSTASAPTATVDQWDRAVGLMLAAAVRYGELDERYQKQRAWLAANRTHPKWTERQRQERQTWHQRNQAATHMMNLAEGVSRVQAGLPFDSRAGLGVLLGHELAPYLPNALAMTAARLRTDDLFHVAFHLLADARAEEESDATDDDADDGDAEHGNFGET